MNLFKILRIVSCVLCALILVACVFIFIYAGTFWGLISLLAAAIFFLLMLMFKGLQEDREKSAAKQRQTETQATEDADASTDNDGKELFR